MYDGAWEKGAITGAGRVVGTGRNSSHFTLDATFKEGQVEGFARITATFGHTSKGEVTETDSSPGTGNGEGPGESSPSAVASTKATEDKCALVTPKPQYLGFFGLMRKSRPNGHGTLFFSHSCCERTRQHLPPSAAKGPTCKDGCRVKISGKFSDSFLFSGGGKMAWMCPEHACSFFGSIERNYLHGHGLLIKHAKPAANKPIATFEKSFLGNWGLGCFGGTETSFRIARTPASREH